MHELEVINTVTNVVNTSQGIIAYFNRYNVVKKYELNILIDKLETDRLVRRSANYEILFMRNLEILENCAKRVERCPDGSLLQKNAMRQLEIVNDKLAKLLENY